VLGAEGLGKRYRDGARQVDAVVDVHLSIFPGSLSILRGPSGSGKTTLLGLLGGVIAPTEGRLRVAGRDITAIRDHHRTRLRREHVGIAFQDAALIEGMTVVDNLLVPFVPAGGATKADRTRLLGVMSRFGILELGPERVERLSGGERQRVALVRALALQPSVLLLDEPTASVDAAAARAIFQTLVDVRDDGCAIVIATHDPFLADQAAVDRIFDLHYGRLVE